MKMLPSELMRLADMVIDSLESTQREFFPFITSKKGTNRDVALSEDSIRRLHALFPDTLVLAALDLIDRQNGWYNLIYHSRSLFLYAQYMLTVIQIISPWGHTNYEVLGSMATYTVQVDLSVTPTSSYCSCPAFAYSVLMAGSHVMVCREYTD
jgi:hypothetical protein